MGYAKKYFWYLMNKYDNNLNSNWKNSRMQKKLNILIFTIFTLITIAYSFPIFAGVANESQTLRRANDKKKFENASQFIKLQEYDIALNLLNEYLEIFTSGIYRVDTYNQIAKIYFDRFNYIRAVKTYRLLYEEFSGSNDGMEAYYNTGICYMKMGYLHKSSIIFKSIINEHPDSIFAYKSTVKLDLLDIIQGKE